MATCQYHHPSWGLPVPVPLARPENGASRLDRDSPATEVADLGQVVEEKFYGSTPSLGLHSAVKSQFGIDDQEIAPARLPSDTNHDPPTPLRIKHMFLIVAG